MTMTTPAPPDKDAFVEVGAMMSLTRSQLLGLPADRGIDGLDHQGDARMLTRLLSLLDDSPNPDSPIVTP